MGDIGDPRREDDWEAPNSTSLSLLERVKIQDPDAWERLVQLYSPLVYLWCRRHQVRAEDAADVFQEVFRAVHGSMARFRRDRPGDSFRGWIWKITQNKISDHFRAQAGKPRAAGGTEAQQRLRELPEKEPETASRSGGGKSGTLFRRGLELVRAEFEERTWQAFWRATIDEEPAANVGAELGMSAGAVRKAKFRVLHRLREEFRDLID